MENFRIVYIQNTKYQSAGLFFLLSFISIVHNWVHLVVVILRIHSHWPLFFVFKVTYTSLTNLIFVATVVKVKMFFERSVQFAVQINFLPAFTWRSRNVVGWKWLQICANLSTVSCGYIGHRFKKMINLSLIIVSDLMLETGPHAPTDHPIKCARMRLKYMAAIHYPYPTHS